MMDKTPLNTGPHHIHADQGNVVQMAKLTSKSIGFHGITTQYKGSFCLVRNTSQRTVRVLLYTLCKMSITLW